MSMLNIDRNPYPEPISVKLSKGLDKLVNGNVVAFKSAKDVKNQELFEAVKPDGKIKTVAFLCEPFHPYLPTETEDDMVFKAEDVLRAEPIKKGIEITVDKKLVVGNPTVDNYVKVNNDGKFEKESGATATADTVGVIVRDYVWNGQDSLRIRFI